MTKKIKKIVYFRFDRLQDLESKLEKYAGKGLFLAECGSFFWTFRKGEPKKLKYAVSYFSEGSVFNPEITANLQAYFAYAKAAGWNFIAQLNQLQIFYSLDENPIPFETDEMEKFENIKKSMKKSFLPSLVMMILVFSLNLLVLFNSFRYDKIGFLSDASRLFSVTMLFFAVLYYIYLLAGYFLWCRRSERAIRAGVEISESGSSTQRIVEIIFLSYLLGSTTWFLLYILAKMSWIGILLIILQIPFLMLAFWSSIRYLKKKKISALKNKIISYTVLGAASIIYLILLIRLIINFNFGTQNAASFRTVTWQLTATESHDFKLYRDELPLTCEDLYGKLNYEYYSYEKNVDNSIFLTKESYRQDSLPAKDSPPRLEYEIIEPHFAFVYGLAKEQLLEIPEWRRESSSLKPLNDALYGTLEAYQEYYDNDPTGKYILLFKDKIITLNLEEPATNEQVAVIKEKLLS